MDQVNIPKPSIPTPEAQVSAPQPVPAATPTPKVSLAQKLKDYWLKFPEKSRKVFLFSAGALGLAIFLLIIFSAVRSFRKPAEPGKITAPTPTLEPVATPSATIESSRYATDSGVLKMEQDLNAIEKDLNAMKVAESDLLPPRLDFEVDFEK